MDTVSNNDYKIKTEKVNALIVLYRKTHDAMYKAKAWELLKEDVVRFAKSNFSGYYHIFDDILQELCLCLNTFMNEGSSFDPSLGINIIYYCKEALLSAGRRCIEREKSGLKFDRKKRLDMIKNLKLLKEEYPELTDDEILELYVKRTYPKLSGEKLNKKIHEKKALLMASNINTSLDEPMDEDGNTLGANMASNDEDFTEKIERKFLVRKLLHIAYIMHEQKLLTELQYEVFIVYSKSILAGNDESNASLAEKMGKSRQNFDRALVEAKKKIKEYVDKYYPDFYD